MIKFIDLKTGNLFSGNDPYIFWYPKGQGVNLFYSLPICFISDKKTEEIFIPENQIFQLAQVNSNTLPAEHINDVDYVNLNNITKPNLKLAGQVYQEYNIYLFYVIAKSEIPGEFIEKFRIGDQIFQVGADFYAENESLYINLSNNGQDIPKEIQKALYPANVHEDKMDNILLNRKWKELLSNYWEVMANKGSYKSLINSLNWFEYGNLLEIYEVWKHMEANKEVFDLRSLQEVLGDKYFETLNGFAKTTYLAIHLALDKITEGYDSEKNPNLTKLIDNWSYKDLSLKLSMLGSFYETYFMPIHLNLIHCTIEDVVYTNTIKIISSNMRNRFDYQYDRGVCTCNVKNGQLFVLDDTHAEAGDDTIFNRPLSYDYTKTDYKDVHALGVNKTAYVDATNEQNLKSFCAQYFNEVGVIVPLEFRIQLEPNDFIKRSTIAYNDNGEWVTYSIHNIFKDSIKFNLLCTQEKEYDIRMQFDSAGGQIYTYRLIFNVIDVTNTALNLYKIQNIGKPSYNSQGNLTNYWIGRQTSLGDRQDIEKIYMQYIPGFAGNHQVHPWTGVSLNSVLILKDLNTISDDCNQYIEENYFTALITKGNTEYMTCVSREFGFWLPEEIKVKLGDHLYINRYSFIPDFHKPVPFDTNEFYEKEFTVTEEDTLCVVPELSFGKFIKEYEWEFVNVSKLNPETIKMGRSIDLPIVAPTEKKVLDPGYYNIVFRFKLIDDSLHEIVLNSAFRKQ